MMTLGRVSRLTRGADANPFYVEDEDTCSPGGDILRAGSKCAL